MKFVHLHTHSHYSLLDGLAKIDELIDAAKEKKMKALALTDHGAMYGVIEFFQKAKKAGIKPIIGEEMYVLPYGETIQGEKAKTNNHYFHLVLLAKDNVGYQNLIKLTSIAQLEGMYYKPRVDWEILKKHKEGLIALSGCLGGEIADAIHGNQRKKAVECAIAFEEIFGKENFYLELQPHGKTNHQQQVNKELIKISKETGIPLVATNDIHYANPDDDQAHDILLCLQTKHKKGDRDRMTMLGEDYSFKGENEMIEAFKNIPEALENTVKIAKRCNVEIKLDEIIHSTFETPGNKDPYEYLVELCHKGIKKRFIKKPEKEVYERMEYELDVIKKMEFASYFLIVQDFVAWAKKQGIVVGPARGSAASSLVSYLLGITGIDPLEYNLLFERFLNPERISMPDFDIDFTDMRRDEVLRYVEEKYGKNHVSQVITFGTMAARASIRDVGRAMGLSYGFCDQIAKLIPMYANLDEALSTVPDLKEIYNTNEEGRMLIDTALRLEGVARHTSTHACAVLITPEPLTDYTPIQYASGDDGGSYVSQYSLHAVEALGLLKIDFLGLKNLSIMETALDIVKKIHGTYINLETLPLDDLKTFELFKKGQTTGVFQLESSGMKRYLKLLKPTEIRDIIVMVSLYRPGPMELIPDYIAGKHGTRTIQYLDERLRPILEETYGIAVYQEQVMQLARVLANFTYAEADVLRKAVGKKNKKLLDEQKTKMIDRMQENNIDNRTAEMIWQFIEPFARYGFNRAHASGYAMIAYQTAYLKAHYPTEFMASLLTADQGDTSRIAFLVDECRRMGIEVVPPDINESFTTFTVVAESLKTDTPRIRFGLVAIKNVGTPIVKAVIHERKERGQFTSLENFLERVTTKDLNKKSLESLIKSGALDNLGERGEMLFNLESLLRFVREVHKNANSSQSSLFESSDVMLPHHLKLMPSDSISKKERLNWERELLGLYITEHPYTEYKKILENTVTSVQTVLSKRISTPVAIGGVVTSIKKAITKNGESMGFVGLEDDTGRVELIVFPKVFERSKDLWQENKLVVVRGKVSDKDGETKILADAVAELNESSTDAIITELEKNQVSSFTSAKRSAAEEKPISIELTEKQAHTMTDSLRSFFFRNPGHHPVYLHIIDGKEGAQQIKTRYLIDFNDTIKVQLEDIIAPATITMEEL